MITNEKRLDYLFKFATIWFPLAVVFLPVGIAGTIETVGILSTVEGVGSLFGYSGLILLSTMLTNESIPIKVSAIGLLVGLGLFFAQGIISYIILLETSIPPAVVIASVVIYFIISMIATSYIGKDLIEPTEDLDNHNPVYPIRISYQDWDMPL